MHYVIILHAYAIDCMTYVLLYTLHTYINYRVVRIGSYFFFDHAGLESNDRFREMHVICPTRNPCKNQQPLALCDRQHIHRANQLILLHMQCMTPIARNAMYQFKYNCNHFEFRPSIRDWFRSNSAACQQTINYTDLIQTN